jgi:hypothetical protein
MGQYVQEGRRNLICVYVVTKIKKTIEGYLIPYEDLKCLDTHYSVLSLFKNENFKEGIFIMNNETLPFIHRNQIEYTYCLG